MSKQLVEKLSRIQAKLKAPKSQFNKFGNYAYRNQEDILEAVKPLLAEEKLVQTISDHVFQVGERVYVRATVKITDGESEIENCAFAREAQEQKGMNEAQITGSASSYARKYALNGMYAIDDTKDADATNTHGKETPQSSKSNSTVFVSKDSKEEIVKVSVAPTQKIDASAKGATTPEAVQVPTATSGKRSFRKPTTGSEEL